MSTSAVVIQPTSQPNGFIRFIDKIGHFFVKAEPVAVELAQEAEPLLALTPFGPEYNIVVEAIAGAQKTAVASLAASTTVTGPEKLQLAVSAATPALTTILNSKGITADHSTHITNYVQAIFGLLAGPAVQAAAAAIKTA